MFQYLHKGRSWNEPEKFLRNASKDSLENNWWIIIAAVLVLLFLFIKSSKEALIRHSIKVVIRNISEEFLMRVFGIEDRVKTNKIKSCIFSRISLKFRDEIELL